MKAATWGTRSSYHSSATYGLCSDGSRWFTDAGFEYHMTLEFDEQGTLVYEANEAVGGGVCGAPAGGSQVPSVQCRTCEILGSASSQPDATAEGGAGGQDGTSTNLPTCLTDYSGTLVLPPE